MQLTISRIESFCFSKSSSKSQSEGRSKIRNGTSWNRSWCGLELHQIEENGHLMYIWCNLCWSFIIQFQCDAVSTPVVMVCRCPMLVNPQIRLENKHIPHADRPMRKSSQRNIQPLFRIKIIKYREKAQFSRKKRKREEFLLLLLPRTCSNIQLELNWKREYSWKFGFHITSHFEKDLLFSIHWYHFEWFQIQFQAIKSTSK